MIIEVVFVLSCFTMSLGIVCGTHLLGHGWDCRGIIIAFIMFIVFVSILLYYYHNLVLR